MIPIFELCNIIAMFLFQAFEKLDEKLAEKGVCVAVKAKLSKDSGVGKGIDFDHIVEKLQAKSKAKGRLKMICKTN